jgi:hypothetical protein
MRIRVGKVFLKVGLQTNQAFAHTSAPLGGSSLGAVALKAAAALQLHEGTSCGVDAA